MAERSQYQYQPITGPVWRAPVAESLSWFPRTQQPARALEYRRLGDFQQPPFDALYKPSDLAWQSHGTAPQIPLERRLLGDFQQPPFTSLYQPSGLQWQSVDRYYGKPLARAIVDFSVYPLQVQSTAYDPSTLEWVASGRYPQIPVERRIRGDFQQPAFDALYRPENIQWLPQGKGTPTPTERRVLGDFQQPSFDALFKPDGLQWEAVDRYAGRPLPYSIQGSFKLDPNPIATVYDPAFMVWLPMGAAQPQIPVERRILGDFQQPPFDTSSPPPPVATDIPLGPWGPGREPVRSMFDASHRRKKRKDEPREEPIVEPIPEEVAPPTPLVAFEAEPPRGMALGDLLDLKTQLELSETRLKLAKQRQQDEEAATLALWWMMQDD